MYTSNQKNKKAWKHKNKHPHPTEFLTNPQNQASTWSHPQYIVLPNPKIDTKTNF